MGRLIGAAGGLVLLHRRCFRARRRETFARENERENKRENEGCVHLDNLGALQGAQVIRESASFGLCHIFPSIPSLPHTLQLKLFITFYYPVCFKDSR